VTEGASPIDEYDLDANELKVHGQDIFELVDRLGFAELVVLAITGKVVAAQTAQHLAGLAYHAARRAFTASAVSSAPSPLHNASDLIAAIAQCLLARRVAPQSETCSVPEVFSGDEWYGYVLFHWIALTIRTMLDPLAAARSEDGAGAATAPCYARALLDGFLAPKAAVGTINLPPPDKLMGVLIGGFGVVAPTTVLARFAASTRTSFEWGLVASAMGCGAAHLGACSLAMARLANAAMATATDSEVVTQYCARKPFPGFGHPIMPIDRRVDYLFDAYDEIPLARRARVIGNAVMASQGLHPNIDFAAGSLFLAYGVPPAAGSLLFWFCRLPIVIAHICAKRREPPFGLRAAEAREKYRNLPKSWL
jgi:2-methylcitrate synthase